MDLNELWGNCVEWILPAQDKYMGWALLTKFGFREMRGDFFD
jgi:hypothetical protein